MEEIRELLDQLLDETLLHLVLSKTRGPQIIIKIRIRPVIMKQKLYFQAALWDGKKEVHQNLEKAAAAEQILVWMSENFLQMQADTASLSASVLISKKGKITIRKRQLKEQKKVTLLEHNRTKRYILEEGTPVPFLVELGVMTPEGRVISSRYDKFRQINRFLEFVEDITPALPRNRELTMIDFGCGKSYLTFAMYYYLREKKGLDLKVIGLDLKEDVIEHCNELAQRFGYDQLHFYTGDIADYEGVDHVDLVVTLHACDTATDFALAKAVKWGARAILSVPCCQHELNGQISCSQLQPVLKYGLLKERMAALITDGLRAEMLEQAGYDTAVLEFIDMEHTPKNILIRAVKKRTAPSMVPEKEATSGREADRAQALKNCMDFLHADPTLYRELKDEDKETKR